MSVLKTVGKVVGILLAAVLLAIAGLLAWLSIREYRPAAREALTVDGNAAGTRTLAPGDSLTLVSWNIGYAALDAEQDFFMDGGQMSNTSSKERVPQTVAGIADVLAQQEADVLFLQEVDRNSARSYSYNEYAALTEQLCPANSAFANNYKCDYVPYPVPGMIGRVDSGLATLNSLPVSEAVRQALPVPFSWPVRLANLKRCLLIERVPLAGTDRELVLINLHLEAYDDGEGKAAQTALLLEILQNEYAAGNYVIAGGDFNQSFPDANAEAYAVKDPSLWAPGMLELDELPAGWGIVFDDTTPSCRLLNQPYDPDDEATQHYLIDGFLVSPNVRPEVVTTLDEGFVYSDHNPVRLQVTLEE